MRMINKDTGVVADLPGATGGAWVPLDEPFDEGVIQEKPIEKQKEHSEVLDAEVDREATVTKKEIMQELDALGVKYDKKASKKELYDLMMKG